MQQPMNREELEARFNELRKSEFFPAIMGAVAGGLTGALMAGLISSSRRKVIVEEHQTPADQGVVLGFSAKDILQLATIVVGLVKQMRDWRDQSY